MGESKIETSKIVLERVIGEFSLFQRFGCLGCGEEIKFIQKNNGDVIGEVIEKNCEICGKRYLIATKINSMAFEIPESLYKK